MKENAYTNRIKEVTRDYWENSDPADLDQQMDWYICREQPKLNGKSLLKAELEYACSHGQIKVGPCKTLVLPVGFSLEPLMQSICVYKPEEVVLLLNEAGYPGKTHESWNAFAQHIVEATRYLQKKGLLCQMPQFPGSPGYPVADRPEAVFGALMEALHDKKDVVIDVTGGKKSMASGAYLYAAYTGARISYVDFDEYDVEYRRPYGYSCRISELSNPYVSFALRDWERVRTLYERYHFREALMVLKGQVMPATRSEPPMQTLAAFLDYYEKWDSGDYRAALQCAQKLPSFRQPDAVTQLGGRWFEISGSSFSQAPSRFYGDLAMLRVYVCDELARIRRLIKYNEDYRSAFLRAGGLNEIVMLARLVSLVPNSDPNKNRLLDALDQRTPPISSVFEALLDSTGSDITIGSDRKNQISFGGAPSISIPHPSPMNRWWRGTNTIFDADDGWEAFLNLRNQLAHKYFSVPRKWAEDALSFVQANVEDFQLDCSAVHTEALPWSDLCDLCDLSRFLPPSLR